MASILERADAFDPSNWLQALTQIGGGYALTSGRRLVFAVDACDGSLLANVMGAIVGHPERQEAIKRAIEHRQNGEVAA
jgi:hypothetical protein